MTEQGHVLAVTQERFGDDLATAASAGATSLTVGDIADFDELGGWLSINGEILAYTSTDDETGVIALTGTLSAAAAAGDKVFVWDPVRAVIVTDLVAQVQVDGDVEGDPHECSVEHKLVQDLPGGIRGLVGESVLIEEEDDDWRVIDVLGLGNPDASGPKWEADDAHVLTEADISSGSATVKLSHRPILESLTLVLGIPQPPTEWTIDYGAKTVTCPLGGWEQAGETIWVHYAYRPELAPSLETVELVAYEATGWKYLEVTEADTTNRSAPGFDDSAWSTRAGAFASSYKTPEYPNAGFPVQTTTMTSEDIGAWLRRTVVCPANTFSITVSCRADGNVWVYWDGVLLGNSGDTNPDWPAHAVYTISGETSSGSHTLAVRFLDDVSDPTIDSSYVDVRVVAEVTL